MLGESAYDSKWFYLIPQKSRYFLLIIQRARRPVQFTAAKIYLMNMQKFGAVRTAIYKNKINSKINR